jgi:MoaA/NifB/PqqE/SkfB family radical SAM enzyme
MSRNINLVSKEKTLKQNRIWVRIASACNNKCIFCLDSYAHNWTFPDEKEVKNIIKSWFKEWYENRVIISWWEASINPKFIEYIEYAKKLGYDRIQTITNWNMYENVDFCKKVFNAWLEEVTFSFHWHNEVLHDYLVWTKWAFIKSLKWLIYIKKNHPNIIVNVDIVVNKVNIKFLSYIVKFFIKLWIYDFDILQIIPFWKWFNENKDKLFYNIDEYITYLQDTWKLSRIPWMYMWTNRFPAEAFIGYEDLIQDPRKIKSEVMWESYDVFSSFIKSYWETKPDCFWSACSFCFQKQYCFDFINNISKDKILNSEDFLIISWEEFTSQIYEKYWENKEDFIKYLKNINKPIINIPKCLGWTWIYETYNDIKENVSVEDYTNKYINNLYRKKSLKCKDCKYYNDCEWIHINFIRSYSFEILKSIK